MGVMRIACCVFVAVLCSLAAPPPRRPPTTSSSSAATGSVHVARGPRAARRHAEARPAAARRARRRPPRAKKKRDRDRRAQAPARRAARSRPRTTRARRAAYEDAERRAKQARRHRRGREMNAVLRTLDGIAARRPAHPVAPRAAVADARAQPRVVDHGRARSRSGQRIEFEGSELVWQYYPGQGLQLQMLGNFGKLNGLWGAQSNARLARHARRAAAARRRARRRRRLGVLLQLRRRPPAVGLRPRAGHGRPGARARGDAAATARPTCCRSPSAALAIFRKRTPTGRPRARRARRPLRDLLVRARTCACSTASSSR